MSLYISYYGLLLYNNDEWWKIIRILYLTGYLKRSITYMYFLWRRWWFKINFELLMQKLILTNIIPKYLLPRLIIVRKKCLQNIYTVILKFIIMNVYIFLLHRHYIKYPIKHLFYKRLRVKLNFTREKINVICIICISMCLNKKCSFNRYKWINGKKAITLWMLIYVKLAQNRKLQTINK